jgi:hypothetical protein
MAAFSTIALLALSAGKTVYDAVEQRKDAKAIEQQGDFESMLYGRNAAAADKQAIDAVARGEETAGEIDRGAGLLRGSQRAASAAAGLDINDGSARAVQNNDAALAAIDIKHVRTNAAREAAGFHTEAENYRMEGDFTRQAAKNKARSLRNQSVATMLSGVGDLARIYQSAPKGIAKSPVSPGYGTSTYGSSGMFGAPRY